MPTLTIETSVGTRYYEAPLPVISVAGALDDALFEEVEFLRLSLLRMTVAPEIDVAMLEYRYGYLRQTGEAAVADYAPLDLNGKFIKIEIVDTVLDDEDDPVLEPVIWYGIIETDGKDVFGNSTGYAEGRQGIQAFGLLRLLENKIIDKSWIDDGNGGVIDIEAGLPFNFDQHGAYPKTGNRSAEKYHEEGTGTHEDVYVFSQNERSSDRWNAYDAVRYILKFHAPKNADFANGTDANPWKLYVTTEEEYLDWYDITEITELRNVKAVLDELINRRRGVSYFAEFDAESGQVWIKVFTFAPNDIYLPSGKTLKANPDQRELSFETAYDVDAVIQDVGSNRYNRIKVVGEFMTTTLTYPLQANTPEDDPVNLFMRDWSDTDETLFLEACSQDPPNTDYGGLEETEQQRINAAFRASDALRHVFCRFKTNPSWDRRVQAWHDATVPDIFYAMPKIDDTVDPVVDIADIQQETIWMQGVKFMRHLPLRDRYDYSAEKIQDLSWADNFTDADQPDYLPILAYVQTSAGTDPDARYEQLEKLNVTSFDDENGRRWAAHVHVVGSRPGIEIRSHPPQMIAATEWSAGSPAATNEAHDPGQMNGIDWREIYVTITLVVPKRVQATETMGVFDENAPNQEFVIYVSGARFDYVVPYTTVGLKYGKPVLTETGGAVEDDRSRLQDIAKAAAEWYGDQRKTLRLRIKQARRLFELGWLITNIGENYSPVDIKTPVTAIEYQFAPDGSEAAPQMTVETNFTALDFS